MATKRAAAAKATSKMTNGASTKVTKDKPAKAAASKPAVTTKKTMAKSRTNEVDEASPTAKKDSPKVVASKKTEKKKAAPPAKAAPKGKPVAIVTRARKSATPAPVERSSTPEVKANQARKRKASAEESEPAPSAKKTKVEAKAAKPTVEKPKAVKPSKPRNIINTAPTDILDVLVFGEGSSGELGLGVASNAVDVKRPRVNPLLSAKDVGVVQVAVGGMHCAALTHDNKILTWGVNDQGALGRDTTWEGGLRDMDDSSDDESASDSGLNPKEATPTAIPSDSFPEGTVFTCIAAGDSNTFAVTDDGRVWGWGTFRSNDGILGFNTHVRVQNTPLLDPSLKNITRVVCGANHVLALDVKGNVWAWGSGQQNQLGRRVVERTKLNGLIPREFGLPAKQIISIAAGQYHSFAIDKRDRVWAWGLNNYGETGIADNAGDDDAVVLKPTPIPSLTGAGVKEVKGGAHHSIAATKDGTCLVWGRLDGAQMGLPVAQMPPDAVIYDARGHPRILSRPTPVPGITVKAVAAGSDTSFAITTDGKCYSWGFSANYQTGQGTDEDVEVATLIDNTAVRGRVLEWAGAGGQFAVLTAKAPVVNGNGV
ncbi:MAG: hypothetical protein M1824_001524 [Vezdaea acicularis]|nr:MAG: hypothetical protein M1824_001524 [Vezdaea acicularis]